MRRQSIATTVLFVLALACGRSARPTQVPADASVTAAPGAFEVQWRYSTTPFPPLSVLPDALGRPYLYAAQQDGGLLVLDVSDPSEATRAALISKQHLGNLAATGLAQRDAFLYVSLGSFFAEGSEAGLAVVNTADPTRPSVESVWNAGVPGRGSSSVLINGGRAYLSAMSSGIFIFDITEPGGPHLLSSLQPDVNFPRPNPTSVQHPNARGSAMHDNVLYVAYDAGGLRAIDVGDPSAPNEIGRYINGGPGAKQQAYNNVIIEWPYLYAAIDYCGLEIINIESPDAMRQAGWWNPWQCDSASNLWLNSPGHTNQIALDAQRRLIYLSAGDSELQIVDVSDTRQPRLIDQYGAPKNGLGAWGLGVSGETLYLTYVQALIPFKGDWAGIKALSR